MGGVKSTLTLATESLPGVTRLTARYSYAERTSLTQGRIMALEGRYPRERPPELMVLADWLAGCGIDTVVLESTGVYWIPLYELLEARGFVVYLVHAKHVKNVPGKKSDVLDCQWLQQLMSFGLLTRAFRPDGEVCALRAVVRTTMGGMGMARPTIRNSTSSSGSPSTRNAGLRASA